MNRDDIILKILIVFCPCFAAVHAETSDVVSPRFQRFARSEQSVIIGDVLKLSCNAVGKPRPYIHWYKDGQIIRQYFGSGQQKSTENEYRHPDKDHIKLFAYTLKINKIVPGDEGTYSCKVWNIAGQIWRNISVVIVDLPKTPNLQEYAQRLNTGHKTTKEMEQLEKWLGEPLNQSLELNGPKSKPDVAAHFQPFFKNTLKEEEDKSSSAMYDLDDKPMSDGSVHYSHNSKQVNSNARVDQAAPYWSKPAHELLPTVASPAGRQVKLSCRANGKPEPVITWYKDNVLIKPSMPRGIGLRYQIKKWALLLEDAVPSDKGVYTCIASNKYGNISHNYTLNVVERLPVRPIINPEYPKNATVVEGENATFVCPLLSDLQPHVRWYRLCQVNGSYETASGSPCMIEVFSDAPEPLVDGGGEEAQTAFEQTYGLPYAMVLVLNNVTRSHEGWYVCLAGNQLGVSSSFAYLTVVDQVQSMPVKMEERTSYSATAVLVPTPIIVVTVLIVAVVCAIQFHRSKTRKLAAFRDESTFLENSGFLKKVIKVYRSDSQTDSEAEQAMIPKIAISSRYQGAKMEHDFSLHDDYEFPLDPEWEISRDDVSLIKCCGEGAFGKVYMSELRLQKAPRSPSDFIDSSTAEKSSTAKEYDHVTVAVKMLKDNASERELIALVSEMEVMKQMCRPPKHPNIINLIGCCTQDGPFYVVVEYCAAGNLLNFLRDSRPRNNYCCSAGAAAALDDDDGDATKNYEQPNSKRLSKKLLTTQNLVQYALQVARGMKYLSEKKCIHRDLAARNVLISEDFVLKIGDFGLARDVTDYDYYRKTSDSRLPIKWMAPECLSDRRYTVKSDVWSYGVLLWEIMTLGGIPYPSVPLENLFQVLKQGYRMNQPDNCPDEMYSLMRVCWQLEPDDRWSFAEIEKYLDDLLSSKSEEYVDVIPDFWTPAGNAEAKADTDDEACEENEEESYSVEPVLVSSVASLVAPPTSCATLAPSVPAAASNYESTRRLCGGAATVLRPISEISELGYLQQSDDDVDDGVGSMTSNFRKSRPSATDSGHPSSPGRSFEGSSDSMDSRFSCCGAGSSQSEGGASAASTSSVFTGSGGAGAPVDPHLKRHSDPAGRRSCGGGVVSDCAWPLPRKHGRRRTPSRGEPPSDDAVKYADLFVSSRESVV